MHKHDGPLAPNLRLAAHGHLYIIYHTGFQQVEALWDTQYYYIRQATQAKQGTCGNAGEFGKGFIYGGPGTLGKQGDLQPASILYVTCTATCTSLTRIFQHTV